MEINKLNTMGNIYCKIGKTSITIKGENNKTKGIIKNIDTFETLSFKRKCDIEQIKIIMRSNLNMKNIVIDHDDTVYYFIDMQQFNKNIKLIERLKDKIEFDVTNEIEYNKRIDDEIKFCNENNIEIIKVNLY